MYFDAHCDITWVTWNIWLKKHLFSMLYIGFPFDKEMGCNRFIDWIWGHVSILGASFRDCFRICLQVTSVFWIFFLNHWIVQLLLNLDAYIHGYTCIWHNALCIILCIYNVHFVNFSPECVSSILRLAEENNLSIIPLVQSIGHFEVGYFFLKTWTYHQNLFIIGHI